MAKEKKTEQLVIPAKKLDVAGIIKSLNKELGSGTIDVMDVKNIKAIPRIPSGITSLDVILGGGWPIGRIHEIYGPESSGKTTVALHTIAAAQKQGIICAYADAEHAYDPIYASHLGVDTSQLLVTAPIGGEDTLSVVEALVRTGAVGLIVIDSVAALVPKKELDGDFGESNVGLHARLMSQAMRKLVGPAQAMNCTILFINQLREKVGVMYGNPEITTGGRALRFYSSIRVEVRKGETLKEGSDAYANHTKVKTVKNKTFPPMKLAEFDIVFGKGVDNTGSIIDLAVTYDIMTKGGGGIYTYGEDLKIKGRAKLVSYLNSPEGADHLKEISQKVTDVLSENGAMVMNLSDEEKERTNAQLNNEEAAGRLETKKARDIGIDTGEDDIEQRAS